MTNSRYPLLDVPPSGSSGSPFYRNNGIASQASPEEAITELFNVVQRAKGYLVWFRDDFLDDTVDIEVYASPEAMAALWICKITYNDPRHNRQRLQIPEAGRRTCLREVGEGFLQSLRWTINVVDAARNPTMHTELLAVRENIEQMLGILPRDPDNMDTLLEELEWLLDFLE